MEEDWREGRKGRKGKMVSSEVEGGRPPPSAASRLTFEETKCVQRDS